ncbi:hypothetical protein PLICRDRAFT_58234 [Plicaturopsis crispa FD-325 SS-3]|uniref:AB hydrolase-1 domain-containing protein n=1 Tax=Plicaturopsis crispa FD-325 SS-3 TaxID=944288 RepID=A0A0C9SKI2_PLICR|nr:hypothetical protein PLICRDRAFT_58234 [Plicaturopsis crispa FD-325 SS-3]
MLRTVHVDQTALVLNGPNGLKVAAKRYTPRDTSNGAGLTLLLAHCIGSCKEQWEIMLERLFALQQPKAPHLRIREAISVDRQNHGDAALLNFEALKARPQGVSIVDWTSAIADFVKLELRGHRIVPIGQSAGAAALLNTTEYFPSSALPYIALFLVEPTIIWEAMYNETREDRETMMDFIMRGTLARRESWPTRDDAFASLRKRLPWAMWDPRAVKLFTEHGLYDDGARVVLKCDRKQEAISYPDVKPQFHGMTQLYRVCEALPVHVIWGDRSDIVPDYVQRSLDGAAASVSVVEDAGHFVVQEKPDALADAIANVLDRIPDTGSSRSRL